MEHFVDKVRTSTKKLNKHKKYIDDDDNQIKK